MGKLLYILYALIVSCTVTLYNLGGGSDNNTASRSWGRSHSGISSGDWYSGGHHK